MTWSYLLWLTQFNMCPFPRYPLLFPGVDRTEIADSLEFRGTGDAFAPGDPYGFGWSKKRLEGTQPLAHILDLIPHDTLLAKDLYSGEKASDSSKLNGCMVRMVAVDSSRNKVDMVGESVRMDGETSHTRDGWLVWWLLLVYPSFSIVIAKTTLANSLALDRVITPSCPSVIGDRAPW
ncbi:unnamed protein product [Cochlearia groenlandica]